MKRSLESLGISQLSVDERLELIGDIWDSITESGQQSRMPDWHLKILEDRLALAEQKPGDSIRWEDLMAGLIRM